MLSTRLAFVLIMIILSINSIIFFELGQVNRISEPKMNRTIHYSYYVCTQIFNESEIYLNEWIEYQLNVIGFKNICLINVGEPFDKTYLSRYKISIIHKKELNQEFNYCLSCFDQSMKSHDLLFIQDIDEFLNIRDENIISQNYHKYDKFHFQEIRYGYIHGTNHDMINRSLLKTNTYRKPHEALSEYTNKNLQDIFNCQVYNGWYSCDEGYGKEMIKVGKIHQLGTHYHRLNRNSSHTNDTLYIDMKQIRLNHYIMRTREDGIQKGHQWNKIASRMGVINSNNYFKMIFDDTIKDSKRLT